MESQEGQREKITEELPTVEYTTTKGRKIIRLSVNTLPRLFNSIYVVFLDDRVFLIDFGFSVRPDGFFEKFQKVREEYSVGIEDIYGVIITHAHIDHFGGLYNLLKVNPKIKVFVHEIDSKAVERFEETFIYAKHYFKIFLRRAGLDDEGVKTYMSMYSATKEFLKSVKVSKPLKDMEKLEDFLVIHTPGHSPGHICLILDDVIFTGDHILPYITPHQFPESIMKYTGTGHYLESLEKIQKIVLDRKISYGLPAHYTIIEDVYKRAEEIKQHHFRRLREILTICKEPKTMVEITHSLFPDKKGYQFILALDEVGAHVEYLWDRGYLSIKNVHEFVENDDVDAYWIAAREKFD